MGLRRSENLLIFVRGAKIPAGDKKREILHLQVVVFFSPATTQIVLKSKV